MLTDDKKYLEDDRLQYIPAEDIKKWTDWYNTYKPENSELFHLRFKTGMRFLNIMYKSGVPILAGTDLGNSFLFPGFSLHDELENFVNAGFTPLAALQTATINPAKYVGKEKVIGNVSKGKLADLVLLDANPLTDISNTRKINAVVANGQLLTRKDLDKLLQKSSTTAKGN
jgi:imidazolonepropionase-like amidohydrolase